MQGDILRETDEHRLLIEDILAPVDDPPREHGSREAVDAARRVVSGHRALVHNPQLALGAIVEAHGPIEKAALNDPSRSAVHRGLDVQDRPLLARLLLLTGGGLQSRRLLAGPVPLFGVAQQVARGVDLRVVEAKGDNLLDIRVVCHVVACSPQHGGQVVPRDRQQLILHAVQHLQEVYAHELGNAIHNLRVLRQRRVLQDLDAVRLRQPREYEGCELLLVERVDAELLAELQHVQAVIGPQAVILEATEVHEADESGHGLVVSVQLDRGFAGIGIRGELLVEPIRLRGQDHLVRADVAAPGRDGDIAELLALVELQQIQLDALVGRHGGWRFELRRGCRVKAKRGGFGA
mmetsp:Transcript_85783/g.232715  ORF Transcript_85783/g.232715 Transcript_85783/m.232715 type:complete len:350 (+) Transcript_85783:414-1463(+)